MSHVREILLTVLIALVILTVVQVMVQSYVVQGESMEPSFHDGQRLMLNKISYRFSSPRMGDVIIFWPPVYTEKPYIKRVIGVPGDEVSILNGKLYLNGMLVDEPDYIPSLPTYLRIVEVVPEGQYFVMGDNRTNSSDSRSWGMVRRKDILGKVWLSYWPPGEWGFASRYSVVLQP